MTTSRIVRGGLIQCANPVNDESVPVAEIQRRALEAHLALIEEAGQKGVQVLCLQEIFNGPYFCPSQAIRWYDAAESVPGPMTETMQAYARKHAMVMVVPVYDGLCGPLIRKMDRDPTHVHKVARGDWLAWLSRHFELMEWSGVVRYLLPGRWYLHVATRLGRNHTPAILVVARR